ncbi:cation:H+ antiporter [Pustulibacterium marinum]|uniref:Cation:H+ antiporter n=1 Tax=Pustulibacterium marinum TaxID=1224947 RepID=A0A1I7IUL8_9FLAO|nr:calcium/sodium antiporter [Pustulibacterium marinum]SFU76582.1 cation:H+ antiporter [Pustulibacterium marinum]
MLQDILFVIFGFVLLVLGGNWLLKSAVALSLRLAIPKIVIGMTIVSLATSAPELIVSISAAFKGNPDIAIGNVVGSNIANLGLVLGITTILGNIDVEKNFYKVNWPVMMLTSVLLYLFVIFDGTLSWVEGILFIVLLALFLWFLVKNGKSSVVDEMPEDDEPLSLFKTLAFLVLGGVALWGGSELLIDGAVSLANDMNISQRIIAVTVIAIGTSVPELAASVMAVIKKEKAISLGNLLGSNIFNILAVLGVTSVIHPIEVSTAFNSDLLWMLGISFLILPLVFFPKRMSLGWREGIFLLCSYGVCLYLSI